jgi:mannose-6-phosphate isomerase-like protein (cupin superfamily)
MEAARPVELQTPFEGSHFVAGAVWRPDAFGEPDRRDAVMKLRFVAGALDLPLHVHEHSARFIIALEGRGFFHVSGRPVDQFDGSQVRTVPVRNRDALLFSPGVVHTFSAPDEPLTLLSYHAPYVPLDDPGQYALPPVVVRPRDLHHDRSWVACDPAWNRLA